MTSEDAYFRHLGRLRRALGQGERLPDYLTAESQHVTDEIRERARLVRDAVLAGDIDALRRESMELAGAGFSRDGDEEDADVPELKAARDEVLRKRKGDDVCDERGEDRGSDSPK